MTTRFYVTNGTATFTPTTVGGTWTANNFSTNTKLLSTTRTGTATTLTQTRANSTAIYQGGIARFVSEPLVNSGTLYSGAWETAFGFTESSANADMVTRIHMFVLVGSTNTIRGTLINNAQPGLNATTEFATVGTSKSISGTSTTQLAVQVGDRIVLEVGHSNPAVLTVAGAYVATMNVGGTGTTDLANSNADTNVTTRPGWLDWKTGDLLDFGVLAPYTLQQTGFRFRFDDGSETTATWRAAANTNVNLVAGENFRLRFLIRDNAGSFPATALRLQYQRNGGTWTNVTSTDTYVRPFDSANVSSDAAVTEQLAGPGTYVANVCLDDGDAVVGPPALTVGQEIEAEFSLALTSSVVDTDVILFRLIDSVHTVELQGYTQTPQVTVGAIAKTGTDSSTQGDTLPATPLKAVIEPIVTDVLTHTDTSFLTVQKTASDVQALSGEIITARSFSFFETHKLAERTPDFVRIEAGGVVDLEFRLTAIAGVVQDPPLILPDYITAAVSPVRNSPGSFQFEYPADGLNYSFLRSLVDNDVDAEVEIWVDGSSRTALRGIILESDGDDIAEVGTRTFSGCFLEWRLSEYCLDFSSDPLSEKGEWFFGAPPGAIIAQVMAAAQADGFLTDITYATFSSTTDSNGVQWANTGFLTVAPGSTLQSLFDNLVEIGMMEYEIDGQKRLKVYNPGGRGLDRTTLDPPLELKAGKHINASPRKHSVREAATDILVSGKDGIYGGTFDTAARNRRGRRIMTYQSQGSIEDPGALDQYAVQRLSQLTTGTTEVTHGLTFGPTDPLPLINYGLGDWVWSDARPGKSREKLRIVQWTVQQDANARPTGTITLNDWVDEQNVKLTQQLAAIQNGSTVVGTSYDTSIDDLAPNKVASVAVGSAAYHTIRDDGTIEDGAVGLRAVLNVTWSPVTLNADSTVIKDLAGYWIRYRYVIPGVTTFYITAPQLYAGTGGVVADVDPGRRVKVSVAAADITGNIGAWSDEFELVTATDDIAPPTPSRPSVTNHLGVLEINWDGDGSAGEAMPTDFSLTEVHASQSMVFTPDATTLIGSLRAQGSITYEGDIGVTYYFRLIAVDVYGNKSSASETASGISQMTVNNLAAFIQAANLAENAVTTPAIAPEAVTTTHLSIAAFSANQVVNGGFEDEDPDDSTLAARWKNAAFLGTTGTAQRVEDAGNSRSGVAAYKVDLANVQGFVDVRAQWIPVVPGEMWYIEVYAKSNRVIDGSISVIAQYSLDGLTPMSGNFWIAMSGQQVTPSYQLYTAQYSVSLFDSGVAPNYMRLAFRLGASTNGADTSAGTFWIDDVRTRKVVGRAEIANAAIGNAQIDNLAVQNGNIANLNVGKLTGGTGTFAMLMASGNIRSGDTGQRWIIDTAGYRAYNSAGTNTINLTSASGSAFITGTFTTGTTGNKRAEINGTAGEMRFYPAADDTRYTRLYTYVDANFPDDLVFEVRANDTDVSINAATARTSWYPNAVVTRISEVGDDSLMFSYFSQEYNSFSIATTQGDNDATDARNGFFILGSNSYTYIGYHDEYTTPNPDAYMRFDSTGIYIQSGTDTTSGAFINLYNTQETRFFGYLSNTGSANMLFWAVSATTSSTSISGITFNYGTTQTANRVVVGTCDDSGAGHFTFLSSNTSSSFVIQRAGTTPFTVGTHYAFSIGRP